MADEKKPVRPDVQQVVDPPITTVLQVLLVPSETMHTKKLSQKTKDYLANFEEEAKEKPPGTENRVSLKSRQDFLDEMTLMHAHHDTPSKLPPDATPEQIAEERERRLNALTTRHRVVFSRWPRNPDSNHWITPENSLVGKTAANGLQLWGATMFDFYAVLRHPSVPNLRTLSVGSKLLGWVKKVGEDYELARSTYEWAEREEDPKTFEPCDIEVLIRKGEQGMRRFIALGEILVKEKEHREAKLKTSAELKKKEDELAPIMGEFKQESPTEEEAPVPPIESTHSTEEKKVIGGAEEQSTISNVESMEPQSPNEVVDSDEKGAIEMDTKPDNEKKRLGSPIPTDKMDGFSVMGEKVVDLTQERDFVMKSDEMDYADLNKMDADEEGTRKLAEQSNDVEMKEGCTKKLATDSKDVEMKEEEPAIEPKDIVVLEKERKAAPEPKGVPLPADEEHDFEESPEITYPIDDLFNQNCYPKGWTTEPFTDKLKKRPLAQPQPLQHYIPQRLLPNKLVVHDPWSLLNVTGERPTDKYKPWTLKEDITHIYKLQTSTTYRKRRKEDDATAAKEDAKMKSRLEAFLADPHSKAERPNGFEMPVVGRAKHDETVVMAYVVLPEVPRPAPVKEAHLYLSPAHAIGVGNHSFVYDAVFEVPRSLLVKEELCMDCVHADVEELLKERVKDLEIARPGKLITKSTVIPPYIMTTSADDENMYILEEGSETTKVEYEGPYDVVVQTRVGYQNPERAPYCEHLKARETSIHPLTTKVSVAAKLSLQHDEHLRIEAYNYQRFPKHFFEHWSGYNIVRPFHQPVPLGAIVPQFYGYYMIDEPIESEDYMSPILLIEKCGTPITFENLSIDDKQECASLLYRLHEAAWTHGSVYERNILRQPGPVTAFPGERALNKAKRGGYGENWSYRLIDFGRSVYVGDEDKRKLQDMVRLDAWKMDRWANGFEDNFR